MSSNETKNKANLRNEVSSKTGKANSDLDWGFVHPESHSSILIGKDGNIRISAGRYAQIKSDADGCITTNSLMNHMSSVVLDANINDININRHKFNNQLIELSDFRNVNDNIIGGIMMNGTVLVKTYEHTLGKWVLMRRPISTPMFSQRLNIPLPPEQMEVDNLDIMDDIVQHYINKEKEN